MAILTRQVTATIATICVVMALTGCRKTHLTGTPLAPRLPGPIKDLTAIRVGDEISLNWTTPRKGTSKLIIHGVIKMRVCRLENPAAECIEAGRPLLLPPGAGGNFGEDLPDLMKSGPPRVAYYSVELLDRNGTPTGLANRVPVLVGASPPPIGGLVAETTQRGVVLRWDPDAIRTPAGKTTIHLRRTEGIPTVATQAMRDGLVPIPTPPEVDLSVPVGSASVIDPDVRRGATYRYRAQRIFRIAVDGQTLEMDGQFSPEVRIDIPSSGH